MKITKKLADKLIQESPSFRKFILDELINDDFTEDHDTLDDLVALAFAAAKEAKKPYSYPKIAAIKEVRKNSIKYKNEIMKRYPYSAHFHSNEVSLTWAKWFVEDFCGIKD